MFRTLKHRLTAFYLLVLVAVLAIYGVGAYSLFHFSTLYGLDHVNTRMLAPVIAEFNHEHEGYAEVIHELSEVAIDDREHLALLTRKGQVLYARGVQPDPEPQLHPGSFTLGGPDPMRMLVLPLERDGETIGYLRVGQSLLGPQRAMTNLALGLAVLAPVAIVLAYFGGTWLAGRAVKPVEDAFERERQFTRDASHELRTPLSVLLSHAQLALSDAEVPPSARAKLKVIERSARRMSLLVGDLLTLGRADIGILEAAVEFSLEELVDEEVESMAPLAEERGMTLAFTSTAEHSVVRGEPARIAQAVRNLLDNAMRYAPLAARIEVGLRVRGGRLELTVCDPGPGIPPEQQERIFDRFVRLEEARRVNPEGSGLGLAISRAVARAHGGDLVLATRPGRTAFTLSIPAA